MPAEKKIIVIITTYNRSEFLKNLLCEIRDEFEKFSQENQGCHLQIRVYDDSSSEDYTTALKYLQNPTDIYHRFGEHHGKKNYWEIINFIYRNLEYVHADYIIQLPDDVQLKENFFSEAISQYNAIKTGNKICLNLLLDESRKEKPNWTQIIPKIEQHGKYQIYRTGWVDLCFISTINFFRNLYFKIMKVDERKWERNPNFGSGVGEQISTDLVRKGFAFFQVSDSLVTHSDRESKMNPQERKINPLIAK